MSSQSLKNLKLKSKVDYDKIVKVHCPVLAEDIFFNAQGFYHLNYEVTGRARTNVEQAYKLRLIKYIDRIVKNAKVIDKVRLVKAPIGRKKKSGKRIIKEVIYTSIIGLISPRIKIKVILRKVGDGRIIFWSVYYMLVFGLGLILSE